MNKLYQAIILILFSGVMMAQTGNELYRPEFHFSPEENWINDPNGLVYYNGIYHMFYQYNPFGDQWGNMSWGHATSTDLVNWEEQPLAIPYANGVMAFSGSAVVDWNNTSGFGINGQPPLVAIYTGFILATGVQDQRIAYSNDEGATWTDYAQNPVINLNIPDFRDPKVIWHEPTQKWIMVVAMAVSQQIRFYRSDDLKTWEFMQDFGPEGNISGPWECPDLFSLLVDGDPANKKWVLVLSLGHGAQYFIGDFDGANFISDNSSVPTGILIDDFESGTYSNWTVEGNAFGSFPASGTLPNQQGVSGYLGTKLVNSFFNGDETQGRLISNNFTIEKDFINFLIGGGNHPDGTYIKLVIDNEVVHTSTGLNDEFLNWDSWDVSAYFGANAHVEIVDAESGGWGHINIDHIIQTDAPIRNLNAGTIDYGKDFYAVQSFSDIPDSDGRRIWLAWMNNWSYAADVPTTPWRGIMSIPREVELKTINGQIKLVQKPVSELEVLWADSLSFQDETLAAIQDNLESASYKTFEVKGNLTDLSSNGFELIVKKGSNQATVFSFDFENQEIRFNRSNSGDLVSNQIFSDVQVAPLNLENGTIDFHLIVDNCSVELFVNNGQVVMSNQIFPDSTSNGIELSASNPSLLFDELTLYTFEASDIVSSNDVEGNRQYGFKIYPNPSLDGVNIIIEVKKQDNTSSKFCVYSLLGQKIYQVETSQKRIIIPKEVFPSDGIYLIVMEKQAFSLTKKYLVNKSN